MVITSNSAVTDDVVQYWDFTLVSQCGEESTNIIPQGLPALE